MAWAIVSGPAAGADGPVRRPVLAGPVLARPVPAGAPGVADRATEPPARWPPLAPGWPLVSRTAAAPTPAPATTIPARSSNRWPPRLGPPAAQSAGSLPGSPRSRSVHPAGAAVPAVPRPAVPRGLAPGACSPPPSPPSTLVSASLSPAGYGAGGHGCDASAAAAALLAVRDKVVTLVRERVRRHGLVVIPAVFGRPLVPRRPSTVRGPGVRGPGHAPCPAAPGWPGG